MLNELISMSETLATVLILELLSHFSDVFFFLRRGAGESVLALQIAIGANAELQTPTHSQSSALAHFTLSSSLFLSLTFFVSFPWFIAHPCSLPLFPFFSTFLSFLCPPKSCLLFRRLSTVGRVVVAVNPPMNCSFERLLSESIR